MVTTFNTKDMVSFANASILKRAKWKPFIDKTPKVGPTLYLMDEYDKITIGVFNHENKFISNGGIAPDPLFFCYFSDVKLISHADIENWKDSKKPKKLSDITVEESSFVPIETKSLESTNEQQEHNLHIKGVYEKLLEVINVVNNIGARIQ